MTSSEIIDKLIQERYQGLNVSVEQDAKDPRIVHVRAFFLLSDFQMVVDKSDLSSSLAVLVALIDSKLPGCICPGCGAELKAGLRK